MVIMYEPDQIEIREVWEDNLESEMKLISEIVDHYRYVAIDTEFPGTVFQNPNINRFSYEAVKTNVNMTKLIQLGITFTDSDGRLPKCGTEKHCVWQFTFREFDRSKDHFAPSSIELLADSGIDFDRNMRFGVTAVRFGELLVPSGVVTNPEMCWIAFHGASDFGYLMKAVTGEDLPEKLKDFNESVRMCFPELYDIKHLISHTSLIPGGLNHVAQQLGVDRFGTSHLAGSDSLLTNRVFLKLREIYFPVPEDLKKQDGVIFGIERTQGAQRP